MNGLDRIISPRSIAIAGISGDASKHGARVYGHLRRLGFSGEIFGVNPGLPEVDGVEVFAAIPDLPAPPDLVISAVPAAAVESVISQCQGVGGVVVFASGFSESGAEGSRLEQEILDRAREVGVRLLGPNSGGVIRPGIGLAASFLTCLDRPSSEIRTGPVGLVTQSGGTGSYLHNLAAAGGTGLALSVSTGNEADIRLGEALSAVAAVEEVEVMLLVVETVRDGLRFVEAIGECGNMGKPVVACLIGSGARAGAMMASHTGASAVPAEVLRGMLMTLGVHIAETPGEAYEVAETVARLGTVGPRAGIVTHSGGMAILLSDLGERHGVELPLPGERLSAGLARLLDHGTASNPLDMGGIMGGPSRFAEVVQAFADSGEYDVVAAVSSAHPPAHTAPRVDALLDMETPVPILHVWLAGDQGDEGLRRIRQAGLAVTTDPRAAIRALAVSTHGSPHVTEPPSPIEGPIQSWGLPLVPRIPASSSEEAVDAAESIGYPVVVKVDAPDVAHKTEIGGVALGLTSGQGVTEAWNNVTGAAVAAGVDIRGVIVEPHRPGLEVVVAAFVDTQLGPVASVGMGGVYTEVVGDVAYAPAPVTERQAGELLRRLRMWPVLEGVRGARPVDIEALARLTSIVGRGILGGLYREVELNPVVWDGEWVVVDCLTA